MVLLFVGVALWWASHLYPIYLADSRARLIARMGEKPYKGAFAVVSLAAVALMVIGYREAPFENLWFPPAWMTHVNNLLMVVAVALMDAGRINSSVRHYVRHPMLTGVKTWAVAHLLVNGDLASVVLFGGMLAWAVVAVIGSNQRDGAWKRPGKGTAKGAVIHVVVTVVVFAVIVGIHTALGVRPVPG